MAETAAYFRSKSFNFDPYQIIQLYMAIGGIPHYLKEVENRLSAAQNIDQICFSDNVLPQVHRQTAIAGTWDLEKTQSNANL